MHQRRVDEIHASICTMDDRALRLASWWMARAEQLAPLVDAELARRGDGVGTAVRAGNVAP